MGSNHKKPGRHLWLWGLLGILFIAFNAFGIYIGTIIYEETAIMPTKDRRIASAFIQREFNRGIQFKHWENITITATDGTQLVATFIPHPQGAKKTIIYLHGLRDHRLSGINYLPIFQKNGYNVLLIDARGHGESQGSFITWGDREKRDVEQWVSYLSDRIPRGIVGIFGASLGGATALLHSEINETDGNHVDFYIIDSAFSDLKTLIQSQLEERVPPYGKFISSLVLPYADMVAYFNGRFTYSRSSPIKAVPRTSRPILYLHGKADMLIPASMSEDLYAATTGQKEIYLFEGAAHIGGLFEQYDRYDSILSRFIQNVEKQL